MVPCRVSADLRCSTVVHASNRTSLGYLFRLASKLAVPAAPAASVGTDRVIIGLGDFHKSRVIGRPATAKGEIISQNGGGCYARRDQPTRPDRILARGLAGRKPH